MPETKNTRLVSLDVFRGITVALMILVNSPGNQTSYPWLEHSVWNGCTLADLVFPFFIFIVGVSVAMTLSKAKQKELPLQLVFPKILKRSIILFLIGLLLNAFPYHFEFASIRVFGVLQRIAICYLATSVLFYTTRISTQAVIMGLLMAAYWFLMAFIPTFDLTPEGNVAAWIDRYIFSANHLYGKVYDPEGLLSTLPAIATALLGNLTGAWLLSNYRQQEKVRGMAIIGFFALLLGWLWGLTFPINKALWTSSFVLWTGGLALIFLAVCYWLIEIKIGKRWAKPFEIFGINALLAYVLHVFFLKIQAIISIPQRDGAPGNLRLFITEHLFGWTSLPNASLLYALSYVMLWLAVVSLFVFYKHKAHKTSISLLRD